MGIVQFFYIKNAQEKSNSRTKTNPKSPTLSLKEGATLSYNTSKVVVMRKKSKLLERFFQKYHFPETPD